jgi:hypothetical protein
VSRPRSIILLIVWFLWAAGKDLDVLARYSSTSDYYIFSSHGMPWLFFVLAGAVFLFNSASVFYLFRPQPVGYPVLLGSLLAGVVQGGVVSLLLALDDLPGVRQAYEIGRELRGLPVRPEAMDLIFTPTAMWVSAGLAVAVYGVLMWLVRRNRSFFVGAGGGVAEV